MDAPSLTYINKLSNGDAVFSKKLIAVIKAEFPIEKELYYKNISLKKFKLAAENVHKIKHKISVLSFETGHVLATQHEENLNEGNTSLELKFEEVLNIIKKYLTLI